MGRHIVRFGVLIATVARVWGQEATGLADLPVAGRESLRRFGAWIGPTEFEGVVDAYRRARCDMFVTSDGPIVAGCCLLERTVMRMERRALAVLPRGLRELDADLANGNLPVEPGVIPSDMAAGLRRARQIIAVARLLLGDEPADLDAAALSDARACAALVEGGAGRSVPPGLESQEVDWTVFRCPARYAIDKNLMHAYRARRWLQAVSFRGNRGDEVAAFMILRRKNKNRLFASAPLWAEGLFPTTSQDSIFASDFHLAPWTKARAEDRWPLQLAPRVFFREDVVLGQPSRGADHRESGGAYASPGLLYSAALGSSLARADLADSQWLEFIDSQWPAVAGSTWVARADRVRVALLDAAEPDAPAAFSSTVWHRKSLRTALGSWVLERSVWGERTLASTNSACERRSVFGLVEPDPDVFGRLAGMGRRVGDWIAASDVDGEGMRLEHADRVMGYAHGVVDELLHSSNIATVSPEGLIKALHAEGVLDRAAYDRITLAARKRIGDAAATGGNVKEELGNVLRDVLIACDRWYARMTDLSMSLAEPIPGEHLGPRWHRWVDLCARLEALAHKQLRGRLWSAEDREFFSDYPRELAEIMGDVSIMGPTGGGARAVAVARDEAKGVARVVATGRPREVWVLYPYGGQTVLCRGVVLSYYECDEDDVTTSAEWEKMIDSGKRPREPKWLTGE